MKTRWKFIREGMKSNRGMQNWTIKKWEHVNGKLEMCKSGFHCSKQINQAFSFVQGEILTKVQVKGKSEIQTDKEVWSDMQVVKAWKWQKKDSVELAIFAAELCLENFEKLFPDDKRPRLAIEAAKRWIENPNTETARAAYNATRAAYSAADRAADGAADSAARAAYSAARAAYSAAYSAARAAYSAAGANLIAKIEKWFLTRIKQLEEIK